MDTHEEEPQEQRDPSPPKSPHDQHKCEDDGGHVETNDLLSSSLQENDDSKDDRVDLRTLDLLSNLEWKPLQENQGNPSPKKLRTNAGSSSVTGLDGMELDLDLRLGTGGSGSKRGLGFGNIGSSVEMGGFASGANTGVQSCVREQRRVASSCARVSKLVGGPVVAVSGKEYICQYCHEPFKSSQGRSSHLQFCKEAQGKIDKKLYVCKTCNAVFDCSQALGGHTSRGCKEKKKN